MVGKINLEGAKDIADDLSTVHLAQLGKKSTVIGYAHYFSQR